MDFDLGRMFAKDYGTPVCLSGRPVEHHTTVFQRQGLLLLVLDRRDPSIILFWSLRPAGKKIFVDDIWAAECGCLVVHEVGYIPDDR